MITESDLDLQNFSCVSYRYPQFKVGENDSFFYLRLTICKYLQTHISFRKSVIWSTNKTGSKTTSIVISSIRGKKWLVVIIALGVEWLILSSLMFICIWRQHTDVCRTSVICISICVPYSTLITQNPHQTCAAINHLSISSSLQNDMALFGWYRTNMSANRDSIWDEQVFAWILCHNC